MAQNVTGAQAPKESTVRDFLEVIFRRKWSIIGIVAVATAIVIAINLSEPVLYESSGRMLVKRGEAASVFSPSVRTLTWEEEITSQIEMVGSQPVIRRAREIIRDFLPAGHETEETVSAGQLASGVISRSNVLWVSYNSGDPLFCQAAVNAIINSYREYYQSVRTPPEMEDFFSEEMARLKEEIDYWRESKARLGAEWGIISMPHQERLLIDRISRYIADLEQIDTRLSQEEQILGKLESFGELGVDEQAAIVGGFLGITTQRTIIERYMGRLMDLRVQESELATNFTDGHRDLQRIRRQIEDLYASLRREIESTLTIKRAEVDILRMRRRELQELLQRLEMEKNIYPARATELDRVNTELLRVEARYTEMAEQHMKSKISMASNPEWTVTILSSASPAYRKKTRDYVRITLGPLFSLIVAVGFAFFVDNLDHSIKNVSDAEETLGIQVLASFPDIER